MHLGRGGVAERRQIVWSRCCSGRWRSGFSRIGAEAVSWIPTLHHAVDDVIRRADIGSRALIVAITIVNGIGEEVFFRGSVYSAFGQRRPALWTTVVYVVGHRGRRQPRCSCFAAALMGTVFALRTPRHPRHPRVDHHPRRLVDADDLPAAALASARH